MDDCRRKSDDSGDDVNSEVTKRKRRAITEAGECVDDPIKVRAQIKTRKGTSDDSVFMSPEAVFGAPMAPTPTQQKSTRSLARGRRSSIRPNFCGAGGTAICHLYSKDLPADERLSSIVRHCAEMTFRESNDVESDISISESAFMLALNKTLEELSAEGAFKLATATLAEGSENSVQPVSMELEELEEFIRDSEAHLQSLKNESKRWDEILAHYKKLESNPNHQMKAMTINDDKTPGEDCKYVVQGLNAKMQRLRFQLKSLSRANKSLCILNETADEELMARVRVLDDFDESFDCVQLVNDMINGIK